MTFLSASCTQASLKLNSTQYCSSLDYPEFMYSLESTEITLCTREQPYLSLNILLLASAAKSLPNMNLFGLLA